MNIADIATLLGSVFTGLSVLLALIIYKRNEDRNAFRRFRLSLVDLRHNAQQLDQILSDPLFTEIGINISAELKDLFHGGVTKEQFINYMMDKANHDYIASAIYLGRQKSSVIPTTRELTTQMEKIPFEFRELLPLTSAILMKLNFYIIQTRDNVTSPKIFDFVIGKPDNFGKVVIPTLPSAENETTVFRHIGLILAATSKILLRKQGQAVMDEANTLLNLLIDKFLLMADTELREQSRLQRALSGTISKINKETSIEDAFEYFKLLKNIFNASEWDLIVETKTKLYQEAHTKAKQEENDKQI